MRWFAVAFGLVACGGSGLSVAPSAGAPSGTPVGSPGGSASGPVTGSDPTVGQPATGAPSGPTTGTAAGSPAGTIPGTPAGTAPGSTGTAWSHTATVDGDPSEYGPDETFAVDGGTVWLTWDADALYVAAQHPDVIAGGPQHWLVVYLGDGTTGTTTGITFGLQTPTTALPVTSVVRWKADFSWHSLETWSGSQWQSTPLWLGTAGSQVAEDPVAGVVELALPDAALGLGDTVVVHVSWVYEGAGYESSYAPSPSSSFTSGAFDPDYASLWRFDRTAATPPAQYLPSP